VRHQVSTSSRAYGNDPPLVFAPCGFAASDLIVRLRILVPRKPRIPLSAIVRKPLIEFPHAVHLPAKPDGVDSERCSAHEYASRLLVGLPIEPGTAEATVARSNVESGKGMRSARAITNSAALSEPRASSISSETSMPITVLANAASGRVDSPVAQPISSARSGLGSPAASRSTTR
jgi:hypothetical protein